MSISAFVSNCVMIATISLFMFIFFLCLHNDVAICMHLLLFVFFFLIILNSMLSIFFYSRSLNACISIEMQINWFPMERDEKEAHDHQRPSLDRIALLFFKLNRIKSISSNSSSTRFLMKRKSHRCTAILSYRYSVFIDQSAAINCHRQR